MAALRAAGRNVTSKTDDDWRQLGTAKRGPGATSYRKPTPRRYRTRRYRRGTSREYLNKSIYYGRLYARNARAKTRNVPMDMHGQGRKRYYKRPSNASLPIDESPLTAYPCCNVCDLRPLIFTRREHISTLSGTRSSAHSWPNVHGRQFTIQTYKLTCKCSCMYKFIKNSNFRSGPRNCINKSTRSW
jgi:hypothetical protein